MGGKSYTFSHLRGKWSVVTKISSQTQVHLFYELSLTRCNLRNTCLSPPLVGKYDFHIFFMWSDCMSWMWKQLKESTPFWNKKREVICSRWHRCAGSDSPWESAFSPLCQQQPKSHSHAASRFTVLHGMTWNNNTAADVVNDPVNPNNDGESLSVSKFSSSQHFGPTITTLAPCRSSSPLHEKKKRKQTLFAFEPLAVDVPPLPTLRHSSCYPLKYIPLTSQSPLHPHTYPPPLHSPDSDIAEVQVGLLYAPVWGDVFGLVAFHVLLHGWQAGAVLQADGALVGRGAVVGAQVLDHGRVVPGSLVAQLALKWLLTWGWRKSQCEPQCKSARVICCWSHLRCLLTHK